MIVEGRKGDTVNGGGDGGGSHGATASNMVYIASNNIFSGIKAKVRIEPVKYYLADFFR